MLDNFSLTTYFGSQSTVLPGLLAIA